MTDELPTLVVDGQRLTDPEWAKRHGIVCRYPDGADRCAGCPHYQRPDLYPQCAYTRPVPAPVGLEREELIAVIMRETTDKIVADGWDHLGSPNVLVQGCKFIRRHMRTDPTEGYADPQAAARKFAEFIADAILALSPDHRTEPASAPIGPRSAGQSETGELVEFFRGEGYSWFGFNGDENGWTPERTAVEAMRDFIRWRLANPKANIPHCQSPVVSVEPTPGQIESACLSYRHDFGILSADQRRMVCHEAREWLRAWQKEGIGADRNEIIERCAAVVDQANREGPYQAIAAASRIRALKDTCRIPADSDIGSGR